MNDTAKLLLKASFVGTFAETMLLPVWAILTNRMGGSLLDAGIGYALFSIVTGVVVIAAGQSHWYQKNIRLMVFWGFLFSGAGDILYIVVHNIWQLFLVQSLLGLAIGLLNPAWNSLFSDMEKGDGVKRWSFYVGGINLVMGLATIAGGFIVSYLGFVWLFVAMAFLDGFAAYCSWKVWRHEDMRMTEIPVKTRLDDIDKAMARIDAIAREAGISVALPPPRMVQAQTWDFEYRATKKERDVPVRVISASRQISHPMGRTTH